MNIDKSIQEIPIEDIIPNRFQPRLAFNEEGITELSESIKQHGIIQPLVVRRLGDKFEIIAGERRYKAATMAGLSKVPVIISDIDDNKSAEVALVENIQRRNLTAIEEAKSYKNLLDRGYLTQEQLANKMGISQSAIANKLRLLNLDEEVQDALLNEKISERHARSLLVLEDKEEQREWLQRIINERLTVRQLDLELKKLEENGGEEGVIPLVEINPNIDEIVNNAEDINVIREPHDVASMLLPEGTVQEEPKIEEVQQEPTKMPNKFFNFLEDEQANMNVIEPEEILNTFTSTTPPIEIEEVKQMEEEPVIEVTENNIQTPDEIKRVEESLFPLHAEVELLDDLEHTKEPANTIEKEYIEPVINEMIFNPVENLTEEVKEEIQIPSEENIPSTPIIEPVIEPPMQEEKEAFAIPTIEPFIKSPEEIAESKVEESLPVENQIIPDLPLVDIEEPKLEEEIVDTKINPQETIENISNAEERVEINNNEIIEDNNIINEEPIIEPVIGEEPTPFKSIFFQNDEEEEVVEETPIMNNTIEEVKPVVEEPIVDPLDRIVTLEPGYQERQEELAGTDLKTAINIVRTTVNDLENRGFLVELEEADLEDLYHITIKIDKNNNQK